MDWHKKVSPFHKPLTGIPRNLKIVEHIRIITHPAVPLAADDCDAEKGMKAPRGTGVTTGCGTLKSISKMLTIDVTTQ